MPAFALSSPPTSLPARPLPGVLLPAGRPGPRSRPPATRPQEHPAEAREVPPEVPERAPREAVPGREVAPGPYHGAMTTSEPSRATETEPEREALDAAEAGDLGPFGVLLQGYTPRLERIAAARLDRRVIARVDPSDVVQDVFVQTTKRLPRYLEGRAEQGATRLPLFLWLRMMVREAVIQVHRMHLGAEVRDAGRDRRIASGGPDATVTAAHVAHLLVGRHTTPTRAFERTQREVKMADALERLGDDEREVIVLRHFEGLSNVEVARLTGLTESGASLRHVRALKRLRTLAASSSFDLEELAG